MERKEYYPILLENEGINGEKIKIKKNNREDIFRRKWLEISQLRKKILSEKVSELEKCEYMNRLERYKQRLDFELCGRSISTNATLLAIVIATFGIAMSFYDFSYKDQCRIAFIVYLFFLLAVTGYLIWIMTVVMRYVNEEYNIKLIHLQLEIIETKQNEIECNQNNLDVTHALISDEIKKLNNVFLEQIQILKLYSNNTIDEVDNLKNLSNQIISEVNMMSKSILSLERKTSNDQIKVINEISNFTEIVKEQTELILTFSQTDKVTELIDNIIIKKIRSINNLTNELSNIALNARIEAARNSNGAFGVVSADMKEITEKLLTEIKELEESLGSRDQI